MDKINVKEFSRFEIWLDHVCSTLSRYPDAALLLLVLVCCFARFTFLTGADPDLFTRFAVGRLIIEQGIPRHDPFAFTQVFPIWHDHELLAGLLYFLTWSSLGYCGIWYLKIGLCALTLFLLRKVQATEQTPKLFQFGILLFLILCSSHVWISTVRAQALSYLFFAVILFVFKSMKKTGSPALAFTLPPLISIWTNTHGGFVVGIGIIGIHLVASLIKKQHVKTYCLVGLLTLAAPLINPYGSSFLIFILKALIHNPSFIPTDPPGTIPEWLPLKIPGAEFSIIALLSMLILYGYYLQSTLFKLEEFLVLLVTFVGALQHYRFLSFFFFSVIAYGTTPIYYSIDKITSLTPHLKVVLIRSFLIVGLISVLVSTYYTLTFILTKTSHPLDLSIYPEREVAWLKTYRPSGANILTHYNDGSYLLWNLPEQFKISLDQRFDGVYPIETMTKTFAALDCSNNQHDRSLEEINPDIIFISKDNTPYQNASCYHGYTEIFNNERVVLLERHR